MSEQSLREALKMVQMSIRSTKELLALINYKVKGNLHWVSAKTGIPAEIRVYDRLFTDPHPDSGDKDFLQALNTDSKQVLAAYIEEGLNQVESEARYQFERHGYFVADRIDHTAQKAVFNLIVNLKDNWK